MQDQPARVSRRRILQFLAPACLLAAAGDAGAQSTGPADPSVLMAVVRESIGSNKPDEALKPTGKMRMTAADGTPVELEMASFEFIGDMHIRFVFDDVDTMRVLASEELAKLDLSPEKALELAVANIKRVYGEPEATLLAEGIFQVHGKSPDLDSSYFLDRGFWSGLLKQHPEGLVVAVPGRGGLLFAPAADEKAVGLLRSNVGPWYMQNDRLRVSSALYLFKQNRWSVYQPPLTR
jgi:hypothetical protein